MPEHGSPPSRGVAQAKGDAADVERREPLLLGRLHAEEPSPTELPSPDGNLRTSTTSPVRSRWATMGQPATRREQASRTKARWSNPRQCVCRLYPPPAAGLRAAKSRRTRSRAGTARGSSRWVARFGLPRVQSRKPASRVSLTTHPRPHRTPSARSSACTRAEEPLARICLTNRHPHVQQGANVANSVNRQTRSGCRLPTDQQLLVRGLGELRDRLETLDLARPPDARLL